MAVDLPQKLWVRFSVERCHSLLGIAETQRTAKSSFELLQETTCNRSLQQTRYMVDTYIHPGPGILEV